MNVELPVYVNEHRRPEREYAIRVVLTELLGLRVAFESHASPDTVIVLPNARRICIRDRLLATPDADWLQPRSLPSSRFSLFDPGELGLEVLTSDGQVPLIEPLGGPPVSFSAAGAHVHLDLLGVAFFFLSRYEELVRTERDTFGRFPLSASCIPRPAYSRPIVNEQAEFLWSVLERVCPGLERRSRSYSVVPTHDVDQPFRHAFSSPFRALRSALAEALLRRQPARAGRLLRSWLRVRRGNRDADPYNTFAWIMDQSERRGIRSAFYFIVDRSSRKRDALYTLDHPWIGALGSEALTRGHEVGLHGSFLSFDDEARIAMEFERLQAWVGTIGKEQTRWGSRQHYLRFSTEHTWRGLDKAGIDYDSTLAFAELAGFRSGMCNEFPVFDLRARRALALRERPLIAMESSVIDVPYMGLGIGSAAFDEFQRLARACRAVRGEFVVLWHNSRLQSDEERALYQAVLDA